MESIGVEEEEEFFESLQGIPSTSSSESSEEDGASRQHLNQAHMNSVKPTNGQMRSRPSFSRYEIWRSNPGTVPERRKRLLQEMGLESQNDEAGLPTSAAVQHSSDPFASDNLAGSSLQTRSVSAGIENLKLENGSKSEVFTSIDAGSAVLGIVRSRSDDTFLTKQHHELREDEPVRLVRSGAASPLLLPGAISSDRLVENSGAVLRNGASAPYSASKPPSGGRNTLGTPPKPAGRSFTEGRAARRAPSHVNNSSSKTSGGGSGTLPLIDGMLDGDLDGEILQRLIDQGQYIVRDSGHVEVQGNNADIDAEILCRIKNLDSGQEFVVNEVGKDGLWNKLKDLDTGRELTLEEFESSLGFSPIVQEVMRRERAADSFAEKGVLVHNNPGPQKKKRGWLKSITGVVKGSRETGIHGTHGSGSDDRESIEKGRRRSGSATDDSQETPPRITKRIKVHSHRKAFKEFTDLHMRQEIQAHQGAIWTMKFSSDGCYLASAGQDRIVRVWEVLEQRGRACNSPDTSGELNLGADKVPSENGLAHKASRNEVKKSTKGTVGRKKTQIRTSEPPKFMLSEKPKCLFQGHTEDVQDLSWSTSQFLLSSSMDKTVRLWHVSRIECLRIFAHNDYVTCIQFNPVDDQYFISGSLDDKVRIWSIKDHKVVDWADLREMVTAASYTPDGQRAVVGSYKGTCRFYNTTGNKLQLEASIDVRSSKGKKSQGKKITGFQFIPGDPRKLLVTSNDSRIRVYDGTEIYLKYKGFRNTNSQISASFSANGKYIVCASEDSHVFIWTHNNSSSGFTSRRTEKSRSYEDFYSQHVLVAIPWPGMGPQFDRSDLNEQKSTGNNESSISSSRVQSDSSGRNVMKGENSPARVSSSRSEPDLGHFSGVASLSSISQQANDISMLSVERTQDVDELSERNRLEGIIPESDDGSHLLTYNDKLLFPEVEATPGSSSGSSLHNLGASAHLESMHTQVENYGLFSDKGSATWPEENLPPVCMKISSTVELLDTTKDTAAVSLEETGIDTKNAASAWGLVIVTAGLSGEIRTFQNYGLPVRL